MSIQLGSRVFTPRLFTTLLTLALLVMLVSLGRWQLRRADEKRVLYESFAAGTEDTRHIDSHDAPVPRYQHVEAAGRYDDSRQVLIDNMVSAERAGYYVITPFALDDGGWMLVNRGWIPLGPTRNDKPAIPAAGNARKIRGRADNLPAPGIQMGTRIRLQPPYPVVASFPTHAEILALLNEKRFAPAAEVILLDSGEPEGYVRNWAPPGFPPLRHIGYAVQWFGLALALLVIYVVVNTRRGFASPEHSA